MYFFPGEVTKLSTKNSVKSTDTWHDRRTRPTPVSNVFLVFFNIIYSLRVSKSGEWWSLIADE